MSDAHDRYVDPSDVRQEIVATADAFGFETETEFLELVDRLVDEESSRIESADFADTTFVPTETTQLVDADEAVEGDDLVLGRTPLVSVASIDFLDDDDADPVDVDSDIRVHETHVQLLDEDADGNDVDLNRWPDGWYEVEYTYGYDEVPGPVVDAIVRLVRSRLARIDADGVDSETLPTGQSVSYRPPERLLASVSRTMQRYRPPTYDSGAMVI